MTEIARRESAALEQYVTDPTGGRLVAWAQAASAANQLARALVTTSFVPKEFAGNVGDATAAVLLGDELGLSPLAALRSIYVVHGAPALYARTMVALALSQGHQVWTEASSDNRVIVSGRRRGSDKVETSEWTMDRARKAGYTSNKKYTSNPQEMLYSKAAAEVCRKIAADALAGVPFSVEDLELETPAPTTTVQREPKKATARLKPVPVETAEPDLEPPAPSGMAEFDPATTTWTEPAPPITSAQSRKLHAALNDAGLGDRAARLGYIGGVVGREIATSKELSVGEASRCIDALTKLLDPAEPADGNELPLDGE